MPITTYMVNQGGLNITDSPVTIKDNQATGQSYNYEYSRTGAITKTLAPTALNLTPDTQLKSLGLGTHHDVATDSRTLIRVAGTKIQVFNTSTGAITNESDDTATPVSDFSDASSTQPVVFAPFNTLIGGTVLWMAGGGMSVIEGYTGPVTGNVTQNGTPAPTGSITPVVNTHDSGAFAATGTYFYGAQFRKRGTQAFSNVSLDVSATVVNTDDTVTLPLTGITNVDTTRFDQIWLWRSAVSGVEGFTTGDIIAELASTATTYKDTGSSITSTQNVPRAGNTILDNSMLPAGTYKYITTFKRRLVTCLNSTLYISDLDKPESWPLQNPITLPTGGPITALGTIGVPSEYTTGADQYLCIWKERELWVLSGDGPDNWELLIVDKTGCSGQSLVVPFNGFITWLAFNGIYIWDGRGKPSRVSKPIQALFEADGDLDKNFLSQGYGRQYEKGNEIIWRTSHRTKGKNRLSIKMDTRLTSIAAAQNLQNPEMEGVFILDTDSNAYYAIESFRTINDELLVTGDDTGFVYRLYNSATTAVAFDYETKPLDMGSPEVLKSFKRVLVLIERITNHDLKLMYWADYRNRTEDQSVAFLSMAPLKQTLPSLWDVALWDVASWDDYVPDISFGEFNLHANENNSQGNSLKLRFEQLEANAPVRIHGFLVEWEPANNIPIPAQQVS